MKFLSEPTTECSAWIPDDLLDDDSWDYTLTQGQADELVAALGGIKRAGLALHQIRAENFPLESCGVLAKDIATSLREGRGFALLHNFPVAGFSREDIEKMYWGFCTHLGRGVTQNSDGSLIHYVTEGRLRPNQGTRSVGNPGKVSLHVDLADCVSLLCLRQAKGSPRSRLASSTALYNHLLEQAPESLARLSEGFVWDRQDEHGASELPTTGYRVPFFSVADGQISCRYNRNWIRRAAQREADGLSSADESLLDLIDELAHAHCFEFPFESGDVQFANNYTMLHGRAPHESAVDEEDSRLLMRVWLNMSQVRAFADESIVRHGILCHGRLGWYAEDVADNLESKVHLRRASDGAPLRVNE